MKRSTTLFLPVLLLVMASCGTPAQYSQQRFQDGLYAKIGEEPEVVRLYSEEDFENMAAAKLARKQGRDTLVLIIDDPWDFAWYSRYNRYHYSPWLWGGLAFGCHYWNRYYGSWYDPFWDNWYGYYGGWYDPWYYSYYDPWYYDPWYGGYGWYGHRYGWYDHPVYPGGYWGGGSSYRGRDVVYTPRSTTTAGGSRERRPGSGSNYRYGTPGSSGSTILRSGTNTRPSSGARPSSSATASTGSSRSTSSPSTYSVERRRSEGYNPSRTYQNKNSNSSGSYSSGSNTRSYSNNSSSGVNRSSSSSSSSRSSGSYGGGSVSHSSGGGGGGDSRSSGSSSHSGGGGGARSGGRR